MRELVRNMALVLLASTALVACREGDGDDASQTPAPNAALPRPPTPTPTSISTPSPTPLDKPTIDNTGVRPGSSLSRHEGDYVVTIAGATIRNLEINGDLYIVADNVLVDNVKVNGNVGINRTADGNTPLPVRRNIRLVNVDMRTMDNVGFDGLTIDKSRFRGVRNSFHAQLTCYRDQEGGFWKADGLTLTNSLFDPPAPSTNDAHIENLHLMCVTNATIRNNVFDMTSPDRFTMQQTTATLFQETIYGVRNANALIEGNYFYGGGYYVAYFHADGMTVRNNRFHSTNNGINTYGPKSIMLPPSAYADHSWVPFAQSGNTLDGQPLTIPFDG